MESPEIRIKRLQMRSMRRGIKEMDLILFDYASRKLAVMSETEIAHYESLLDENDQDLYQWVSGQMPAPDRFSDLIADIARGALGLVRPA